MDSLCGRPRPGVASLSCAVVMALAGPSCSSPGKPNHPISAADTHAAPAELAPTVATTGVPRLERTPCATRALAEAQAECFTFYGEEDWSAPNGTVVEIPLGVINANSTVADTPVVFFPGGPGYSIIGNGEYIEQLKKDVDGRPLVVLDHRGFIHARPSLRCPEFASVSPYHNIVHTPAITASPDPKKRMDTITGVVESCYKKLVDEGIDVAQYNSYAVSRDVDEIRRLLGYDTIDIFGSSTGSGTALLFAAYFPDRVRSAIFGWPWYNHLRNRPFVDEFYTAKHRFTDILMQCGATDDACRNALPDALRALDRARRALDDKPYVETIKDPGGTTRTLYFDGAALLDTLYLTLHLNYAKLPRLLTQIQTGDYSMLPELFRTASYDPAPEAPNYALGYYLAHICNDMGSHRPSVADSTAAVMREPAILGFEAPWLCAWWGGDGDVPPRHLDRVASDAPGLAIHGQLDPCCSTRWSQHVAETMPGLQIVELQGVGHSPTTECRTSLIRQFLADPEADVDDSCRDAVPLEPWVLP